MSNSEARPPAPFVSRVRRSVVCSLLACVALSCGDASKVPTEVDRTLLRVVSGADQTDTALAVLQPLVVEVRDSTGRLAPGQAVRFKPIALTPNSREAFVYVSAVDSMNFGFELWSQTDARGRVKMFVQLGFIAGTAPLQLSVPSLGVADTIEFTVRAGEPAYLTVTPADTMVSANATYTIRSTVTDKSGNLILGAAPTFSATGVSVSSSGQVTTGSSFGRGTTVARYGTMTETSAAWVQERLTVVGNQNGQLVSLNTDGTSRVVLDVTSDFSLSPHAVKTSTSIVYFRGDSYFNSKVWVVQPGGTPRQLLPGAPGFEAWPRLSPDGVWVYFVRNNNTLWRAHLDGSSLDSLGKVNTSSVIYRAPTISPDGGTVAVQEGVGVKFINVATKASTIMTKECRHPRYSPDGKSFVCWNSSGVVVMNTDGTGTRTVAPPFSGGPGEANSAPDWTPDGKWIVTGVSAAVVNVATGASVPVSLPPQASFVR